MYVYFRLCTCPPVTLQVIELTRVRFFSRTYVRVGGEKWQIDLEFNSLCNAANSSKGFPKRESSL